MISVLVLRRFACKANGRSFHRELRRRVTVPIPPTVDVFLDFGDDHVAQVATVRVGVRTAPALGIVPDNIVIHTRTEPGERVEAALEAGWVDVHDQAREAMNET